jgi:hypothetical protein
MTRKRLSLSDMFIDVRNQVRKMTIDQQEPWEEGGLRS